MHLKPDRKPVWLQTNKDGETYAPFRLDIKESNVTWIGGLPHSWSNQVDALNGGKYDSWLSAKPFGYKGFKKMPMTLGHYTRADIPFYYAMADAFTICDQHFCSSLTGTTPNRLYLWTGTIRPKQSPDSRPHVYNEEADHEHEVNWTTFPERLEDAGVSWKIYQNELDIETGLPDEEDAWLANFGDNPIEYFSQYNVRFSARYRAHLEARVAAIPGEIDALGSAAVPPGETANQAAARSKKLDGLRAELKDAQEDLKRYSSENFDRLSQRDKNLHAKAFSVNEDDPHFRELETLSYRDGDTDRTVRAPKGDLFHQFRQDVQNGNLPTVSWIVGPERFSDHPASAWFGAWYVSEALDILTQNPDVWKKTIFILNYDENDGYFDHVPPFVAPNPSNPESGLVSDGIDAGVEYITHKQDLAFRPKYPPRDSSIGLGFRVPLLVASPWSRGGCVCSQVFDHTSVLQFLEKFLSHKTGKQIAEPNISSWRRAVCGDLTSIFKPHHQGDSVSLPFSKRDDVIEAIHLAQFKSPPAGFKILSDSEIADLNRDPTSSPLMPSQEPGTRPSCPLPYELYVDGNLNREKTTLEIRFKVGNVVFGKRSAGSAFNAYAYRASNDMHARAYAVSAGKTLADTWQLSDFESGKYRIRVDGPNGFMREFAGDKEDPAVSLVLSYGKPKSRSLSGDVELAITNQDGMAHDVVISDRAYGNESLTKTVPAGKTVRLSLPSNRNHGWYDFALKVKDLDSFERRYAGRVETGKWSITDPAMGRVPAR